MVFSWFKQRRELQAFTTRAETLFVLYARGDFESRLAFECILESIRSNPSMDSVLNGPLAVPPTLTAVHELLIKNGYPKAAGSFRRKVVSEQAFSWDAAEKSLDPDVMGIRALHLRDLVPDDVYAAARRMKQQMNSATSQSSTKKQNDAALSPPYPGKAEHAIHDPNGLRMKLPLLGNTKDRPLVIEASTAIEGIEAEYSELEKRFGKQDQDWKLLERSHRQFSDKYIETFRLSVGEEIKEIHFEISSFFGKGPSPFSPEVLNKIGQGRLTTTLRVSVKRIELAIVLSILTTLQNSNEEFRRDGYFESVYDTMELTFSSLQKSKDQVCELEFTALNWVRLTALITSTVNRLPKNSEGSTVAAVLRELESRIAMQLRSNGRV